MLVYIVISLVFRKVRKMSIFKIIKQVCNNKKPVNAQAMRVNSAGENLDELDKDGNLPFGWVTYNKNYVDMIEKELDYFRKLYDNANGTKEKRDALKSYFTYLEDGKVHYNNLNVCVGKYFEDYICDSQERKDNAKRLKRLEEQLKNS